MTSFDFAVDLANIIGVALTLLMLVEIVRTKRWAKRKLAQGQLRWDSAKVGNQIDAARRIIRRMLEEDRVLRSEGWRNELQETLAELRNEPSLSLKDQRIIQRFSRGLHVPVKDDTREKDRLRYLLLQLAETKSQIAATLAAGDME